MTQLSWNEIESRATRFAVEWKNETSESAEKQTFWNEFFEVFGLNRRRIGGYFEMAVNLRSRYGFIDVFLPGKLLAEHKSAGRDLRKAQRQGLTYLDGLSDSDLPRLIVSSDFRSFDLLDLETNESWTFSIEEFPKRVRLFSILLEQQREHYSEAAPVSRKAAEKVAEIHGRLEDSGYTGHFLELFLTRLVFCLFAEDSGIFSYKQFYEYLRNRTSPDGSDLGPRLNKLFTTLNTPVKDRSTLLDKDLMEFPYVNGSLFAEVCPAPDFDSGLREAILRSSDPDWREVSPAIFGAMFQAVLDPETRKEFGSHYTSEENILRVLKPLFLDELYIAFEEAKSSKKKRAELEALHTRISQLGFLDPACGSGAFLIVAYRELRKLEHKIVTELVEQTTLLAIDELLKVEVAQFSGIEILESSALIARVSMWLVDHQMNLEASGLFGRAYSRLPLPDLSTIVIGNAADEDWESCGPHPLVYIIGNPPFSGSRLMTKDQKNDLLKWAPDIKRAKSLDYVALWFLRAAKIMKTNPAVRTAFVATNSVSQGLVASVMWPALMEQGSEIEFAYETFRWTNLAKGVAQVHVVVIGFGQGTTREKHLFQFEPGSSEPIKTKATNINPYLIDRADNFVVPVSDESLFNLPELVFGNMPDPAGLLVYDKEGADDLLQRDPEVKKFLRFAYGGKELLTGQPRFALWLEGITPGEQRRSKLIDEIVTEIRAVRLKGSRPENASLGGRFAQISQPIDKPFVLIPATFVAQLAYLPARFFSAGTVSLNSAYAIPGAEEWLFALLSSKLHYHWMNIVGGKLKSDFRYSKEIVYNNFPVPQLSDASRTALSESASNILETLSKFEDEKLADLYRESSIPRELAKVFADNDKVVLQTYGISLSASESDMVSQLLTMLKAKLEENSSVVAR